MKCMTPKEFTLWFSGLYTAVTDELPDKMILAHLAAVKYEDEEVGDSKYIKFMGFLEALLCHPPESRDMNALEDRLEKFQLLACRKHSRITSKK